MMRLLRLSFLAALSILTCQASWSQTLHYVSVAETSDVQLPREFAANKSALDEFIRSISDTDSNKGITGLKLNMISVEKDDFDCLHILKAVENLNLDSKDDDVIIFYYSGHGESLKTSPQDPSNSDFPKLLCGKTAHDQMPTLEDIYKKLNGKGARLLIVVADSCNNVVPPPEHVTAEVDVVKVVVPDQIRDLLRNYRGYVLISSAKPGEFSFYKDHSLGYFTKRFLEALAAPSLDANTELWEKILARATSIIDIPPHNQLPNESPMQKLQHPLLRKELQPK